MYQVYKVVHQENGQYISCIIRGPATLHYEIGKETVSCNPTSPIFCFDDPCQAEGFALGERSMGCSPVVLLCETREQPKPINNALSACSAEGLTIEQMVEAWKTGWNPETNRPFSDEFPPVSSVGVHRLTPVKVLDWECTR